MIKLTTCRLSISPIHLFLQQAVGSMRGPISVVFVLHPTLCAEGDDEFLGQLMSVAFFVTGVSTIIQATFGLRYILFYVFGFLIKIPVLN